MANICNSLTYASKFNRKLRLNFIRKKNVNYTELMLQEILLTDVQSHPF